MSFDAFGNNELCLTHLVYFLICQHWELDPITTATPKELHFLLPCLMELQPEGLGNMALFLAMTLNHVLALSNCHTIH